MTRRDRKNLEGYLRRRAEIEKWAQRFDGAFDLIRRVEKSIRSRRGKKIKLSTRRKRIAKATLAAIATVGNEVGCRAGPHSAPCGIRDGVGSNSFWCNCGCSQVDYCRAQQDWSLELDRRARYR